MQREVKVRRNRKGEQYLVIKTGTKCKIRNIDQTFVAIAGQLNFDAFALAEESCRKGRSLSERADIFTRSVEAPLKRMVESWRNSSYYEQFFGPARSILEIIFFGVENGDPAYVIVGFRTEPRVSGQPIELALSRGSCPGKFLKEATVAVYLGRNEAIKNLNPDAAFFAQHGSINGLRQLIELEIKEAGDEVGPPIDILRITKDETCWANKKPECDKEQKAKPCPSPVAQDNPKLAPVPRQTAPASSPKGTNWIVVTGVALALGFGSYYLFIKRR